MREQLIRELEIIPVEVVVRNIAAGSIVKRFNIEEGSPLPRSIVEYYYKADELDDPMVAEEHITAFGWGELPRKMDEVMHLSLRVNDFLSRTVSRSRHPAGRFQAGVRPVVEQRRHAHRRGRRNQPGQLPAMGCLHTNEIMDKDRFRRDLGSVEEALSGGGPPPRHSARKR